MKRNIKKPAATATFKPKVKTDNLKFTVGSLICTARYSDKSGIGSFDVSNEKGEVCRTNFKFTNTDIFKAIERVLNTLHTNKDAVLKAAKQVDTEAKSKATIKPTLAPMAKIKEKSNKKKDPKVKVALPKNKLLRRSRA